jgi:phage-related protein
MFGDNVARIETADTRIELNLNDSRFADLSALLIEVSAKSDAKLVSEQYLIKKLAPAEQEKVKKSLSEISAEVSEPTALNKFFLAGFYEEKGLLIDAIAAYEETIRMAPDVPFYAEAYNDFLIRQGLKKK